MQVDWLFNLPCVATPAFGTDTSPRTVTTVHAVNDGARTTTVTDPAGTVTSTVDLLGRTVAYTDASGIVTTTSYDQAGRVTGTTSQGAPGGGGTSTLAYTYRADGQLASVSVDGTLMATVGYDANGELDGVSYPFGTLGDLVKTPAGALVGTSWTVGVRTFTETLTRSQSGRITASEWTDTATATVPTSWAYTYDPVGRLTQAVLTAAGSRPQVTFGYGFAPTGGCGADPAAGANGSRTSSSTQIGSNPVQTSQYCYDHASRLTHVTGTNPINSGDITYDPHGNATRIGDQTFTYDAADRTTGTSVVSTGQTLAYTRDSTGRVITRTATGPETGTTHYGFTADDDSPDFQLTTNGGLAERYVSLPGGILLGKNYTTTSAKVSIPNLHGDITVQLELNSSNQAATINTGWINDPYGQPLNHTTGTVDLTAMPQTRSNTGTTDSWLGQHQRSYEHTGGLNQILMGARTYLPHLGIFTSTDPIQGGGDTTYTYPNDPINHMDLDGKAWLKTAWNWAVTASDRLATTITESGSASK